MLVHVSQRKDDQRRIARAIQIYIQRLRDQDRFGGEIDAQFAGALAEMSEGISRPSSDAEIIEAAKAAMHCLEAVVLNSDTGEQLNYDTKPARQLIAVRGNRLSRGLTLEGLTVSYFLRTTTFCDTLLQMARWYGFRGGYEDLIRIWTTDGIARWFTELALVEQSLRDAIVVLNRAGKRPDQMVIRLRAHSELLLTSRSKSRCSEEILDSWSGEHPQTVLLPLHEPSKLLGNHNLTDRFLSSLRLLEHEVGGYLARDIDVSQIAGYLRAYQTHDDVVAFDPRGLSDWMLHRAAEGELKDWAVFLPSTSHRPSVIFGGKAVGLVKRSRISSASIGILIDPRHEGVDWPEGPAPYRRAGGTFDADAMRAARPLSQGLLIIYPLDAAHLGVAGVDTVVAIALSLPKTSDAAQNWVVNRRFLEADNG